jgi:Stage II sporulation protein E (SpoIIE)
VNAPGEDWPCGLLTLAPDGTVVDVNSTLLGWVGRSAAEVVGGRVHDLLAVGPRIFWETHLAPLLHVEGRLDEVALDLRSPQGRVPVLLSARVEAAANAAGEAGEAGGTTGRVRVAVARAGERVRYEQELRAARADAERAAAQVGALQQVTASLGRALGVDGVVEAVLDAAVGALGAGAATIWTQDPRGRLVVRGERGATGGTGEEVPAPALLAQRRAVRDGGRVVVPLHGAAGLRGALAVTPSPDPAAEPLDLDVLAAVGQQTGLALDRALLYEHTADVARELQHSLLAVDPPPDPRFAVAATYRPGVEMLEVGGDWYDTFLVSSGLLAVVVGDVVGRGLGAASAMGQLRSAVRAVADPGVGPARLLARLDRFVEQVEAASMATLAYAELDLATGELRYACAGHPPPLLLPGRPEDGHPRLLWDGRSTPLGAYGRGPRVEAAARLAPGDRLLLYTDGLVERRDRGLDERLGELVRVAGRTGGLPLTEAVHALSEELLRDEQGRDDVCTLLVERLEPLVDGGLPHALRP